MKKLGLLPNLSKRLRKHVKAKAIIIPTFSQVKSFRDILLNIEFKHKINL